MVLVDKLLTKLKETGHRVLIFSQMVGKFLRVVSQDIILCMQSMLGLSDTQ